MDAFQRPPSLPDRLWVGLSGGLDSTVLLHRLLALTKSAPAGSDWARTQVCAIHVNHGLQSAAADFEAHCRSMCERLEVPLVCKRVRVEQAALKDLGVEAAARRARLTAFGEVLEDRPGAVVLAHHLNDQIETALLQWLRGAGIDGICGMPDWTPKTTAEGRVVWIWRPMLKIPRTELLAEAVRAELRWVEDPTNLFSAQDRNRIRHAVIPVLTEIRQGALQSMDRSLDHFRALRDRLQALTEEDLRLCRSPSGELLLEGLTGLPQDRRQWVIRAWLREQGLPMPPARRIAEFCRQLEEIEHPAAARCELPMRPSSSGEWAPFRVVLRASIVAVEPLET